MSSEPHRTPTEHRGQSDPVATMRCLTCDHEWQDLDAACNEYPEPCPACGSVITEPAFNADGLREPRGWTWGMYVVR